MPCPPQGGAFPCRSGKHSAIAAGVLPRPGPANRRQWLRPQQRLRPTHRFRQWDVRDWRDRSSPAENLTNGGGCPVTWSRRFRAASDRARERREPSRSVARLDSISITASARQRRDVRVSADHGSICTPPASTAGRSRTIAARVSVSTRVDLAAVVSENPASRRPGVAQHISRSSRLRQPVGERLPLVSARPAAD